MIQDYLRDQVRSLVLQLRVRLDDLLQLMLSFYMADAADYPHIKESVFTDDLQFGSPFIEEL